MKRLSVLIFLMIILQTSCGQTASNTQQSVENYETFTTTETSTDKRSTVSASDRLKERKKLTQSISYSEQQIKPDIGITENDACAVCGFSDDYIFYSIQRPLDDDDDIISYYRYDRKTSKSELIYSISNFYILLKPRVCDNNLIICDFNGDEAGLYFVITIIGLDNNVKELCREYSVYYPKICVAGSRLIVTAYRSDEETVNDELFYYDLNTFNRKTAYTCSYKYVADQLVTGTEIMCVGGWDNGIVFECNTYDNEPRNQNKIGKKTLYYYDFDSGTVNELPIERSHSDNYISGNNDIVVTNIYSTGEPLPNTGSLHIKENNIYTEYLIPGVEAAHDIWYSNLLDDGKIFLDTKDGYYVIDAKNMLYTKEKLLDNVCASGTSVGFMRDGIIYLRDYTNEST